MRIMPKVMRTALIAYILIMIAILAVIGFLGLGAIGAGGNAASVWDIVFIYSLGAALLFGFATVAAVIWAYIAGERDAD